MKDIRNVKMRVKNRLLMYPGNEQAGLHSLYSEMNEEDIRAAFTPGKKEAVLFNILAHPDNPDCQKDLAEIEATRENIKENNARLINEALRLLGLGIVFER